MMILDGDEGPAFTRRSPSRGSRASQASRPSRMNGTLRPPPEPQSFATVAPYGE